MALRTRERIISNPTTIVPFNDLARCASTQRSLLLSAVSRVLDSGWFVLGPEVSGFEAEFAAQCGVQHCASVANGSDALALALAAIGVGAGDEVATCANAAMYSTLAILSLRARPVFVEIERNHTMSPELFAQLVRNSTGGLKAVVVTHLYGQLADIEEIVSIARTKGIAVVEDCAQAHGAMRHGKLAGSFGDIGTFSFYPTKNLGALGDGGAVVSRSLTHHERVMTLRQYGWGTKYQVTSTGGRNSRLDELQAAILRVRLPMLAKSNTRRREIAGRYVRGIQNSAVKVPHNVADDYVAHLFVVTTANRGALQVHLHHAGIATDIHYPICDHQQPTMRALGYDISLPVSEEMSCEVLSLPCFPDLRDDEVDAVISAVNSWRSP